MVEAPSSSSQTGRNVRCYTVMLESFAGLRMEMKPIKRPRLSLQPLGPHDPVERVRRSRANVRLEGLHADPRTEALVAAMARGEINADKAVGEIRSWYAGRT